MTAERVETLNLDRYAAALLVQARCEVQAALDELLDAYTERLVEDVLKIKADLAAQRAVASA